MEQLECQWEMTTGRLLLIRLLKQGGVIAVISAEKPYVLSLLED